MNLDDRTNKKYNQLKTSSKDPSRVTKKNVRAYIKEKDNGYLGDFNKYCYDNGLGDGRKMRNGKQASGNNWRDQIIPVGIFLLLVWAALYYYGGTSLFLPIAIGSFVVYKVLGRSKTILLLLVLFIVYCYFKG